MKNDNKWWAKGKEMIETPSGLKYTVNKVGEGEKPILYQPVKVHYTGLFTDSAVFDSSVERGVPFSFPVGLGKVIAGWDEAVIDMRAGEKRTLEIPPHLAYGSSGSPPNIPPNATLIFEVELLEEE